LRLKTSIAPGNSRERCISAEDAAHLRRTKQIEVCILAASLCRISASLAFSAALLFSIGLFSSGQGVHAQSTTKFPDTLRTLTKANEVHSLTTEEAKRAYPVHLRAVVTYYDPSYAKETASIFVQDGSGGVYASLQEGINEKFPPGTLIDITGVSGPGGFAPIVDKAQVKVIGHAPLPSNPHRVSLLRMHSGIEDCQWVEVEGIVRSVVERGHNVRLQLQMEGGIVGVVMVKEEGVSYSNLVDANVRLRATVAPMFNKSSQIIAIRLMCPGLSVVKVLKPALGDPFLEPVVPIDGLLRWNQVDSRYHRQHVRGTVTLLWPRPDSLACIRDATRGICAHTDQNPHLAVGDDVDVVGFVEVPDGTPALYHPLFRKVGSHNNFITEPVTVEQVLESKHDSELIWIDGQLIGINRSASDITLVLTSGKNIFNAVLPKKLAGTDVIPWKIGSRLRVTGICSIGIDTGGNAAVEGIAEAESFGVLMRSPADITVLERPSWWSVAHTLALLAVALLVMLVVIGWVVALRRQVARQTILIRESEQRFRHMALHDSLTGLATRLLLRDRLSAAVETANRRQKGLTLLMLDLDNFKNINDTLGHRTGDEVLRITAARLLEVVRKSDTVARMGGDEFIVLLPDLSDPDSSNKFAAVIVKALADPIQFEGHDVRISASVGVCSAPAGQLDTDALLRCADAALYHAKANGRNCFQVFTTDMDDAHLRNVS
jgi:diguanylate cyclase (GGDEF)-like protein